MKLNYKKRGLIFRLIACIFLLIVGFNGSRVFAQGCTPPGASILLPETLSCSQRTIVLHGTSSTIGASFVWTGPSGFSSFSQDPTVSLPGTYNLVVTSPTGECTSTATVEVQQNIIQPDAGTQVSNVMTCANPVITVSGISSTQGATFSWLGPGDFTSDQQYLNVTIAGGYTLMVKDPANGCISTATAYVEKNIELPTVSAYVSGDLTCLVNLVNLTSSSATAGVSYSWTGPGFGTPVLGQNTSTSVGGIYTIKATNPVNGCFSEASVNVVRNITEPGATIAASTTTITCAVINANLSGQSSMAGVSYSWSGPNLNLTVQNITVAAAGKYILTVNSAQNGCISKDTVDISVDKIRPDATGLPSGPITCTNGIITLKGSSSTSGVTYKWIGPSTFGTKYEQNPTTSTAGGYILSVTNTSNGCITTKPVVVQKSVTPPASITAANNGPLTCTTNSITLTGSSTTPGVTYSWLGPNNVTYLGPSVSVSTYGIHYLTVLNPANGCSATTSTNVARDVALPNAVTATNDGSITCIKTEATLSGNSTTSGVTYEWKNQGGITISNSKNTVVTTAGLYRINVTNPSNGCVGTALTSVGLNTTKPALIQASNDGPLTCTILTSEINASSSTSGVSYKWDGPGNFTSTAKNPTVTIPGTYNVVITNTQNGCKDSTSTVLAQNAELPGVSLSVPQTLTCDITTIPLQAGSITTGVQYIWTGPGTFSSSEQNPFTTEPGNYTVTVVNPVNNCASVASTSVTQDTTVPSGVTSTAQEQLTCTRSTVSLVATSDISNVTFDWTGPNAFISSIQNPDVTLKGNYILTVTSQSNGCKSIANVTVEKDSTPPQDVNAVASGILNCENANVTLTGSSSTPDVAYSWIGPGVNSSTSSVSASTTGAYNLIVTNTNNGCTANAIVVVEENHITPTGVSASASGILTCGTPFRTVTVTSTPGDMEYSWTGPNDFASNEQTPSVGEPGVYDVVVTHPESKCFTTNSVTVLQDTTKPVNVTARASDIINCNNSFITLIGETDSSPVTYNWEGPDGYTSNIPMPNVSETGNYIFTVTKTQNGCSLSRSVFVDADTALPTDVTGEASNLLDCDNTTVTLTGSSSTPDAIYEWYFMDNLYDPNPVTFAIMDGDYTLVVTHPVNGCTNSVTIPVIQDITPPECSLNVSNNSTVVQQSDNTISTVFNASYSYSWSITNWTPLSGQNTQTLSYRAANTGTTSRITANVIDNNNGCDNSCFVNLSAVAFKSGFSEEGNLLVNEMTLSTYPVPSGGKVYIEFASPEQTDLTITLYSINGSVVATLFDNMVEANLNYTLVVNETNALPAGTYVCVLKTRTETLNRNIIIK